MTETTKPDLLTFNNLGIDPKILDIVKSLNFIVPTPIQLKSIPVIISGKDMVGIAQTGTGKTLAFGIPILQRLAKYSGRCLILVPTRELASQVNDHLKVIAQKLNLKSVVLIGGESKYQQTKQLQRRPEIIVATPGRLIDHLETKTFNLNEVKILVLDEADLMFDMGFAPQLNKILRLTPQNKQTILFSATMPVTIMDIATKHMSLPLKIEVAPAGTPAENVLQEVIILHKEDRLTQLAKTLAEYHGSVLIFVRTKSSVKNICRGIEGMKHTVTEIHSNRSLVQRTRALQGFKDGRYRVLVATDIAARGIDVKGIELVVNFDLPDNIEDYIHRIGRTGRAGKMGQAISYATPSQIGVIRRIEKLIKKEIPLTKLVAIKKSDLSLGGSSRSSGFSTARGYKGHHRTSAKYQDQKWVNRKPSSTDDRTSRKFETSYRSREKFTTSGSSRGYEGHKPRINSTNRDYKPYDRQSRSDVSYQPSQFSKNPSNRLSASQPVRSSRGYEGHKHSLTPSDFNRQSFKHRTDRQVKNQTKSGSFDNHNQNTFKPSGFNRHKNHKPFNKRNSTRFKPKSNFSK